MILLGSFTTTSTFQSAHLREVRCHAPSATAMFRGFNPCTYERCDHRADALPNIGHVSIRAPAIGTISPQNFALIMRRVSIRAPAIGTMATHSKIRQVRALATPLSAQNRHNLGNPFPPPHPCDRSLRKKTSRFYDHLRFALECFLAHLTIICVAVAKFRSPPLNDLLLVYRVTQPSNEFDLTRQSTPSPPFPLVYPFSTLFSIKTSLLL